MSLATSVSMRAISLRASASAPGGRSTQQAAQIVANSDQLTHLGVVHSILQLSTLGGRSRAVKFSAHVSSRDAPARLRPHASPTDDLRIEQIRPLIPPAILMENLPLSERASTTVAESREAVARVLRQQDDRLVVVVGPCSIHDVAAAREYARGLQALAAELADALVIVMRVYFEKPRTTVGWKGLINDPHLDGTFRVNEGLNLARGLLLDLAEMGLPAGCEFLDTITPQYIADLVSWGAIGARTTESQVHRELASGLSVPVGFKNGTDGNIQIAIDAIQAAGHPHHFLSVTKQGLSAIVATRGNPDCHLILRGGQRRAELRRGRRRRARSRRWRRRSCRARLMIDCSHGNSRKDPSAAAGGGARHRGADPQRRPGDRRRDDREPPGRRAAGRQAGQNADATARASPTPASPGPTPCPTLRELADAVRARRRSVARSACISRNQVEKLRYASGVVRCPPGAQRWTSDSSICRRGDWPRRMATCPSDHAVPRARSPRTG